MTNLLTAHPRATYIGGGVLSLLLVAVIVVLNLSSHPADVELVDATQVEQAEQTQPAPPEQVVELPDDFSLVLVNKQLVLRWLGSKGQAGELWSLASGEGDKRCQALVFNDGSRFRPMQVVMTPDTHTEAWFSALDSKAVINNVAKRGSAELCGYQFSLTGTQARLQAHSAFAPYL